MYSKDVRFAFIKATQGDGDYKDPDHFINSDNAIAAGLLTAPYHFYIEGDSPFGQAQYFKNNSQAGLLPPVLDVEKPPWYQLITMMREGEIPKAKRTKAVMQWLSGNANAVNVKATVQTIEGLFGVKPLIYSNLDSWKNWVVGDKSWAGAYPLWIAGYWYTYFKDWMIAYLNNKNPVLPAPFIVWEFWQFTAYAPGKDYGAASASLDLNFYNGDEAALVAEYGTLPPPDPLGEPQMQFINTGGDISNIRYAPVVNTTNIIGKLPDGAQFIALELDFTAGYAWAKYTLDPAWLLPGKTGTTGWSALVAISGNPLIDFHAAVPCPEGEPSMTPEQLARLEAVEATTAKHDLEITVLQNTASGDLPMTHRVVTTQANGEKLHNNPDSGEHVMLANGTEVRLLSTKSWKGMHLYGLYIGGMPVWGYLPESEVIPL